MPGKPLRPGTSDSRGGARPGAGRKSKPLSPRTIQQIRAVVDKRAKKEGRTVADILLHFVYGTAEGVTTPQRIRAAKTVLEYYFKGRNEEPEQEEEKGCPIYLPPRRPDPAKLLFGQQQDK